MAIDPTPRSRRPIRALGLLLVLATGAAPLAAQECSATIHAPAVGSDVVLRPGAVLAERVSASEVQYVNPFGVRRRRWEEATIRYRFVGRTGEYAYGFEEITARDGDRGEQPATVLRLSYWIADDTTQFQVGDLTLRLTARGGTPVVHVVAAGDEDSGCGEPPDRDAAHAGTGGR